MSTVRRSLLYTLADSYFGVVLQLVSTFVLSRLLSPTEIGIFAVAAVFAALASTFRDFGVAEYLIQVKDLTRQKIAAAFTANLVVSWLMAVLLLGMSSIVGDFYGQVGVGQVIRVQALSFLLIPFGAVTIAYFRRELNYKPVFIAGALANLASFGVAVGGALAGWGYIALAWSSFAGVAVNVLVSMLFRPKDFPLLPSFKGIGEVIHFGKYASGIYLFGQLGKSAPEAVIGRLLDMPSVAYYSRGNGLLEMFNRLVLRAVMPVCLPYFSKAAREGKSTADGFVSASALITGIGWPFLFFVGLFAYSAINLLYGPQWTQAILLAQILCLAAITELPYYLAGEVLIAIGRVDKSNRLQFVTQGTRIASLALVIPFGLAGACVGLVVASLINLFVSHYFLKLSIGLQLPGILSAHAKSACVAGATALPALAFNTFVGQNSQNYAWGLFGMGALTAITWLIALWGLRHPLWLELAYSLKKAGVSLPEVLSRTRA